MNDILITRVTRTDIITLQNLSKKTFYEAFSWGNTPENMQSFLDAAFSVEKLESEIADSYAAFYFATFNKIPIGYLKVNCGDAQTELKDARALEIERIYVLSAFQSKKVGQMLFDKACAIAQESKVNYMWLGVWEKNPRAIRFYERIGFVAFDKHIFKVGNDEQTDILMKLELREKS